MSITRHVRVFDCNFFIRVSTANEVSEEILDKHQDEIQMLLNPVVSRLAELARAHEDKRKNLELEF